VVSPRPRPPVTVIVPFRGDRAAAQSLLETLGVLRTGPEDQLIVADNTPAGVVAEGGAAGVDVVRVPAPPSARRARNEGARRAANQWLLFLDADCRPDPGLLDEYFSSEPAERCGVIAGEVIGDDSQAAALARWARSRRGLMARYHVESGGRPAGIAGNLMLRREAWEEAGGFEEGARSEADIDLCWRVQEAGWSLEYRPEAAVAHRDPTRLRDVLRQAWMYGLGKRWLRDRWGTAADAPRVAVPIARAIGGAAVWTLRGRFERAVFKLVDGLVAGAGWLGYQAARRWS
jgi:cellulose synthase/poly-beta-1,6-N-acetylglucosamine synthase-like glycosyltransferase